MFFVNNLKHIIPFSTNNTLLSFLNNLNTLHNNNSLLYNNTFPHNNSFDNSTYLEEECGFTILSMRDSAKMTTFVSILVALIILLTVVGNLMVMISFRIEPQIRTISNSFLLSLAVADLTIGLVSIPLFSMYLFLDFHWPLPMFLCDVYLSIDYTMSNASVANLLVISFDRYFSVTRPLTYRVRRTPTKAGVMIALAWIVSILLWTPWIMLWPHIVEDKRVDNCYIAFMDTSSIGGVVLIMVTCIGAFFLPVFIMCVLYFKIYMLTEKRKKGFNGLQGTHAKQVSVDESEDKTNATVTSQKELLKKPFLRHFSTSPSQNSRSSSLNKQESNSLEANNNSKIDDQHEALNASKNDSSGKKSERTSSSSRLTNKGKSSSKDESSTTLQMTQKKKKNEKKQEQKAAKTLSAILLAFIITWTPYNVFTVIQTFHKCAIPPTLYNFGYWLCYLNSTVNPVLYALCNNHFRSAFLRILRCQCRKRPSK